MKTTLIAFLLHVYNIAAHLEKQFWLILGVKGNMKAVVLASFPNETNMNVEDQLP